MPPAKVLIPVCLLLRVIGGASAPPIQNPGFEAGRTERAPIPAWAAVYDGIYPLAEIDGTTAHSGGQSARITGRLPLDRMRLIQTFRRLPPGRWEFSVWYRTATDFKGSRVPLSICGNLKEHPCWQLATIGKAYLCVRHKPREGGLRYVCQPLEPTHGKWCRATISAEIPPDVSSVQFWPGINSCQGSVWFDDVELSQLAPDASLTPKAETVPFQPVPGGLGDWQAALRSALPHATRLSVGRPRLFFTSDSLPALREELKTTRAREFEKLREWERSWTDATPQVVVPGSWGNQCHAAGRAMGNLAMLYSLTGDELYAERAIDWMMAAVRYSSHGKDRYNDLMSSSIMFGLAMAYDCLYDLMTTSERARVEARLLFLAESMYQSAQGGYYWCHKYWYNHFQHQIAAMGIAGLALLGQCPEANPIVVYAAEQLRLSLELLPADGSPQEGIGYFTSGMLPVVEFATALRNVTGANLLKCSEGLRAYPRFLLHCTSPGLRSGFNFGDIGWRIPVGLMRVLASEYRDSLAQWLGTHGYTREHDLLLPIDESVVPRPPADAAHFAHFRDLDIVTFRTGWSPDDIALYLKCGSFGGRTLARYAPYASHIANQCGHGHCDQTSVTLHAFGERLVTDIGYSAIMSAEHSVIVVDGQGQLHLPRPNFDKTFEHAGRIEHAFLVPGLGFVQADATKCYPDKLAMTEVTRRVAFMADRYFIVDDVVSSTEPHEYRWLLHSNATVETSDSGARLVQPNAFLDVRRVLPKAVNVATGRGLAVWPKQKTVSARFLHVLWPAKSGGRVPSVTVGGHSDIRVEHAGQQDVYLAQAGSAFEVGTDGETAVVIAVQTGTPSAFLIRAGTRLSLADTQLVSASQPVTAARGSADARGQCWIHATVETTVRVHLPFEPGEMQCSPNSVRVQYAKPYCTFSVPAGVAEISFQRGRE